MTQEFEHENPIEPDLHSAPDPDPDLELDPVPAPAPAPASARPIDPVAHEPEAPLRRLSTMVGINFLLLLVTVTGIGLVFLKVSDTPASLSKTPATPEKSEVATKPEDVQSVASQVDQLKASLADLTKKLDSLPVQGTPPPELKAYGEKVDELSKTIAEFSGRFDSLNQKMETVAKGEGLATLPKVDAIEKRIGDLAQAVDSLKTSGTPRPTETQPATTTPATTTPPAQEPNVEGQVMEQAIDLFKKGKYAEAKEAFARLQATFPDDARVWYFSALANGLATRDWKGETERLLNVGLAKEKVGSADSAKVDAAFADLTKANGKDWLAYYRSQIKPR